MNHPEGQQQHILCQLWVGLPRSHRVKDNHYTSFFDTQKQLHNTPRTLYATCNLNRHCFSVCLRGTGHVFIGRSRNDVNNWVNVTKNLGLLTRVHVKKVSDGRGLRFNNLLVGTYTVCTSNTLNTPTKCCLTTFTTECDLQEVAITHLFCLKWLNASCRRVVFTPFFSPWTWFLQRHWDYREILNFTC